jgi:uncharacterized damage-inducible protein DinB
MAELDLAAHLHETTEWAYHNLVNDLNALSEEQATTPLDPGARPATHLVAECAAVNRMLADLLAEGAASRPTPEEREAYFAGIRTRADALDALQDATDRLYKAVDGAAPDRWGEPVQTPFGPWTRARAVVLASQHMMYHDGQINSLHLRHGDAEMHWK